MIGLGWTGLGWEGSCKVLAWGGVGTPSHKPPLTLPSPLPSPPLPSHPTPHTDPHSQARPLIHMHTPITPHTGIYTRQNPTSSSTSHTNQQAERLKRLTLASSAAMTELQSKLGTAETILQLCALCRKFETEQEKVVPFLVPGAAAEVKRSEKLLAGCAGSS